MPRRRIAIVCEYFTLNGGERSLLAALEHVDQSRFDVTVLAPAMVTVQVAPDTLAHPDQDFRMASAAGAAVSVTVAPFAIIAAQPSGEPVVQAISGPVIVPEAVPDATAVSG